MNPPKQDPETLYAEAKKIVSLEERSQFLKKACGEDHLLKQRLEALLQAGDRADSFFEQAAFPFEDNSRGIEHSATTLSEQNDLNLKPNDKIGPYKLMEKVGEGGFGVVWAAEQREPIKQRVALKIIKVGMDTKQVVARFEAERQALALMNHPNIAKVLGAGSTESGRPYFCMELIRGIPITQYCDENKLSTQERLDLFTKVCNAIQHAHQKGVIHRDIKPANILVTLHDGVPVPKVIDFGVAKAVEMELTEKTIYTQIQQFIGTPAYMSPEQAEMSGLDIDTRSDIYSLGVLLYELLTGRTPFTAQELMQSGLDEMRRMIREKDPERPSMRLSSLQAEERTSAAQRRSVALPDLIRSLRGDLDWIVIKALEKDRTRRYETANGMAADIKRHLENEPIVARPPSTAYRLQKAWQRNKTFYMSAAAVFIALCVGMATSLWQARKASLAKENEIKQREAAETAQAIANENATLANQLQKEAEAKETEALDLADQMRRIAEEMRLRNYVSDMYVAHHALEENNRSLALTALDRHRPKNGQTDLRDLAWRYLWMKAQSNERRAWEPYDGITFSALYSPDGKWLTTLGFDKKIRIWKSSPSGEPASKEPVAVRGNETAKATNLAVSAVFSNQGNEIAFLKEGVLVIADTSNWNIKKELGKVMAPIAYSHSDRYLAATANNIPGQQSIQIWDLKTSKQWQIATPFEFITTKFRWGWEFAPDEKHIYMCAASLDHIRKYDLNSGEIVATIPAQGIRRFKLSPTGRWIACISESERIQIWDTQSSQLLHQTEPQDGMLIGISMSQDESLLAITSTKEWVKIWSLPDLSQTSTFNGHHNEVWNVQFSPDNKTLVSAGKENRVLFWDVAFKDNKEQTKAPWEDMLFENFPGATRRISSTEGDQSMQIWKITQGSIERDFQLPVSLREYYYDVDLSVDGLLAVKTKLGGIDLIHTQSGKTIKTVDLSQEGINFVQRPSLSPDEKWIMCIGEGKWRLIQLDKNKIIQSFEAPKSLNAGAGPAFSPDGTTVAFASNDDAFHLWNLEERKESHVLRGHTWTLADCKFSPDGTLLATSSVDGTIRIWNAKSGQLHVPPLHGHVRGIQRVDFSPDGKTLISGGDDKTVRFWNVATGQEMLSIPEQSYSMLSEDGNTIVLYNYDHEKIKCIAIPTLEEIDRLDTLSKNHVTQ